MRRVAGLIGPVLLLLGGCGGPGGWDDVRYDAGGPDTVPSLTVREPTGEGLTLVRAEVEEGREAWLLLDSGSSLVVLDERLARRLGLPVRARVDLGGCGVEGTLRTGTHFRLGGVTVRDPVYVTLDLSPFLGEVDAPVPIEGVVGEPFLHHAVVRVDYGTARDRVTVHEPARYRLTGGRWIAGGFRHGRPVAPFRLSAAPDVEAWGVVDTGKSGGASLSSHFAERIGLPGDRPVTREENRRICGISREDGVELEWVEVAGRRLEDVEVRLRVPGTEAARNEDPNDAVLGRAFLERFSVVLDFSRERVALIENDESVQEGKR